MYVPLYRYAKYLYSVVDLGSKRPIIVVDDAEDVDEDGIYQDISIASITPGTRERRVGKTRDVDAFFKSSVAVQQNDGSDPSN